MHSAQKIVLDGMHMEEVMASVPDAPLHSRPMAGNTDRNSSDYGVPKKDQTSRPTEGVTSPAPSRYSVMQLHLDSQPSKYQLQPDRSRYAIPDDIPRRQVEPPGNQTVPDFLVDSDVNGGGNAVPKLAPLELVEHSTSVEHSLRQDIRRRTTHQAEECVFMTVRQCQTEVIIQCRRHRRSLQNIRPQGKLASSRHNRKCQNHGPRYDMEW